MSICKGHIYIITCHVDPKIYYIGSTYDRINQRWSNHKGKYKSKGKEISIFEYFDKYGIEKFSMHLIKSYDVYRENHNDHKHLRAYEQLWINKLKGCCNKNSAFQPLKKEKRKEYCEKYYKDNKEQIKEKKKQYKQDNKEKIKQKSKEYKQDNKEKILEQNKQYYQDNKEKIKQYSKEYKQDNKEQIKEYQKKYCQINKEKIKQYKKEYSEKQKLKKLNN